MNPAIESFLSALRVARADSLSLSQLIVLVALHSEGALNMTAIGKLTGITTAAITVLADSLETSGYVYRHGSADRRMTYLSLTEHGILTVNGITFAFEPVPA